MLRSIAAEEIRDQHEGVEAFCEDVGALGGLGGVAEDVVDC